MSKQILSDKSVAVIDNVLSQVEGLLQEEAFECAEIRKDSQKGDIEEMQVFTRISNIRRDHQKIKWNFIDLQKTLYREWAETL